MHLELFTNKSTVKINWKFYKNQNSLVSLMQENLILQDGFYITIWL